jgi:hypothetical protein
MRTNCLSIRKRNSLRFGEFTGHNQLLVPLVTAGLGIALMTLTTPVYSRLISPVSTRGVQLANKVGIGTPERSGITPSPSAGRASEESFETIALGSDKPTRYIGNVLITARHTGFEPSEINRPAGPVFLSVQNRSGYHEVALRLDRETGGRLFDVRVPRSKLDWQNVVHLQPGRYVLTDAYHPDWSCTITVTPK